MGFIARVYDFLRHWDVRLGALIQDPHYGWAAYVVLFVIVFMETGFVVTPFLPGDSLIFFAGAMARKGWLDVGSVFLLLSLAAILGDTVNYWIGHYVGPRAFTGQVRFLKKAYLDRTHAFYQKHGGKTIIIARFIPIIRTFAPFVAGIGAMNYRRFIAYNVIGGVGWVAVCTFSGYAFGTIPWVDKNFELVIVAIVLISVMPIVIEFLRHRRRARAAAKANVKPAAVPADDGV